MLPIGMCLETHSSDELAPSWMVEKLQPLKGDKMEGSVARCCLQRGLFFSTVELLGCRKSYTGSREWLLYTVVFAIVISRKFPNTVSQLLEEVLSMKHAQFTAVLIFLYSVLFYKHIKDTNKDVIRNPV